MEITPLPQTEIDALFFSADTKAYFDDTCTIHDVKIPIKRDCLPVGQHKTRPPWQFAEYKKKSDKSIQGRIKWRKTVIEDEEDPHCVWFWHKDGKIYVVDSLDPDLLGL